MKASKVINSLLRQADSYGVENIQHEFNVSFEHTDDTVKGYLQWQYNIKLKYESTEENAGKISIDGDVSIIELTAIGTTSISVKSDAVNRVMKWFELWTRVQAALIGPQYDDSDTQMIDITFTIAMSQQVDDTNDSINSIIDKCWEQLELRTGEFQEQLNENFGDSISNTKDDNEDDEEESADSDINMVPFARLLMGQLKKSFKFHCDARFTDFSVCENGTITFSDVAKIFVIDIVFGTREITIKISSQIDQRVENIQLTPTLEHDHVSLSELIMQSINRILENVEYDEEDAEDEEDE